MYFPLFESATGYESTAMGAGSLPLTETYARTPSFTFLANAMLLPSGESTNIPRKMSNDDRIGMSSSEGQIMPPLTRDADCFDTL